MCVRRGSGGRLRSDRGARGHIIRFCQLSRHFQVVVPDVASINGRNYDISYCWGILARELTEPSSLHEGSVVKRAGASFTSFRPCEHRRLGSGPSRVAATAASPYMRSGPVPGPAPECLLHEAWPRRGATHLKRGGRLPAPDEDGRAPRAAVGGRPRDGGLVCYAATSTPSGTRPVSA